LRVQGLWSTVSGLEFRAGDWGSRVAGMQPSSKSGRSTVPSGKGSNAGVVPSYISEYIYIYIYIIKIIIIIYTHIYIYINILTYICSNTCICIYTCSDTCIYIYTYIYVYGYPSSESERSAVPSGKRVPMPGSRLAIHLYIYRNINFCIYTYIHI